MFQCLNNCNLAITDYRFSTLGHVSHNKIIAYCEQNQYFGLLYTVTDSLEGFI